MTRLPGEVREFFPTSDIDFVAVWDRLPAGPELAALEAAHRASTSSRAFDGFHCTASDLDGPSRAVAARPVYFGGSFDALGGADINPVTWHELAQRPVVVRGSAPRMRTDLDELVAYTRNNLDTYWRDVLTRIETEGPSVFGADDAGVAWVALGAPRLHHLLTTRQLTSKSGAGRYVIDALAPRWARIAREALRIRETPRRPGLYDDPVSRGADARDLLRWVVEDGVQSDYPFIAR